MARRRMISQELISDPDYNNISIEAQNIFIRMLSVSDDCGVVPTNTYKLNVLINTPPKLTKKIQHIIDELVANGMGNRFEYNGESYFAFKRHSFEEFQSYILKKATKSEYLRIPKEDFIELSKKFQEIPRNSGRIEKSALAQYKVESKEYKVDSKKIIPTESEIIEYCKQHGFPDSLGTKIFKYYDELGWKDSGGKPVRSWKSKCQAVWFKEENKTTPTITATEDGYNKWKAERGEK